MATDPTSKKKPAARKKSPSADLQALVAQLTNRIDQLETQLVEATREKPVDRRDVPVVDPVDSAETPLTDEDVQGSLRPPGEEATLPKAAGVLLDADGEAPLSDKDIADLFAQADQLVAPKDKLTASDLQNLLDDSESASYTPPSATMMSDLEVAQLMQAAADEQAKSIGESTFDFPSGVGTSNPGPSSKKPADRPRLTVVSRESDDSEALDQVVPLELAAAALARPIALGPGKLVCEVAEPFDHEALADISRATGRLIETVPTSTDAVVAGLRELYSRQTAERRTHALVSASPTSSVREWLLGLLRRIA